MHVENELAEIVTIGDHEFEEVIEEYEKEILIQEEVTELSLTNLADNLPTQGKPPCITLILNNYLIYIYICDVHLCYMLIVETICIDIPTYESY